MKKFFLLYIIFGLTTILTVADETTPLVVWTDGGDVWVWQNAETIHIPIGDAIFPYLSPYGEQIALVRGEFSYPEKLSVVSLNGDNLRDIDLSYPRQVIWQSETVLWVNTYLPIDTENQVNQRMVSHLLYRVNLETNTIDEWDMGREVWATISPDRNWLIVIDAGIYGQDEGAILQLSLTEDMPTPVERLSFPAISSGSHGGYYPFIQWMSDSVMRLAISEPDAIYHVGEDLPEKTLWELHVDGTSRMLGVVYAPLYPVSLWSGDGDIFVYPTMVTHNQITFALASSDGREVVNEFSLQEVIPLDFIPNRHEFFFVDKTKSVVRIDSIPQPFITISDGFIFNVSAYTNGILVEILYGRDNYAIAYASWEDGRLIEVGNPTGISFFDAKWD